MYKRKKKEKWREGGGNGDTSELWRLKMVEAQQCKHNNENVHENVAY